MHRFAEVMRSGAEPPLIQKRSRHAALVSSACFAEAGQPLRPMRQAAAVPFSWAEAPCRKHIYIGARSAVRPDWLRYYSDTGWLWLFLLAAHRARSVFRSQVAGQQWLPRIAHTRSSGVAPPQHPFPLAPPHRATNGVPCWAPPAKKATKNPCAPRPRRWLAPYRYPYPYPLP